MRYHCITTALLAMQNAIGLLSQPSLLLNAEAFQCVTLGCHGSGGEASAVSPESDGCCSRSWPRLEVVATQRPYTRAEVTHGCLPPKGCMAINGNKGNTTARGSVCSGCAPVGLQLQLDQTFLIPLIMDPIQSCQQSLVDVSSPGLTHAMQAGCLPQTRTKASSLLDCSNTMKCIILQPRVHQQRSSALQEGDGSCAKATVAYRPCNAGLNLQNIVA